MAQSIQWTIIAVSFLLQALLLTALVRGSYRRFPVVFAYSIALFLTSVVDVAAITTFANTKFPVYATQYYRTEAIRQLLLFAVVVSLIDQAIERGDVKLPIRFSLFSAAIFAVAVSLFVHRGDGLMVATKVSRDMSFLSVFLTLALWLVLISRTTRDRILLMVTGGLGLQFTGEAIGQSIRQLSKIDMNHTILLIGNLILVGSHILRLYVWWETFRSKTGTTSETPVTPILPAPSR